jgi:ribosome-binding protein aMBF1 (putative translation factor)
MNPRHVLLDVAIREAREALRWSSEPLYSRMESIARDIVDSIEREQEKEIPKEVRQRIYEIVDDAFGDSLDNVQDESKAEALLDLLDALDDDPRFAGG